MSPGPIPPGPLVPFAWITLGYGVALVIALLFALSGCSSAQPNRECSEESVAALVARCATLVRLECSPRPEEPCAAEDTCDAELAALCPKAQAVTP